VQILGLDSPQRHPLAGENESAMDITALMPIFCKLRIVGEDD
jgi:hypothetical protein